MTTLTNRPYGDVDVIVGIDGMSILERHIDFVLLKQRLLSCNLSFVLDFARMKRVAENVR
jgi:hypothetical protein